MVYKGYELKYKFYSINHYYPPAATWILLSYSDKKISVIKVPAYYNLIASPTKELLIFLVQQTTLEIDLNSVYK